MHLLTGLSYTVKNEINEGNLKTQTIHFFLSQSHCTFCCSGLLGCHSDFRTVGSYLEVTHDSWSQYDVQGYLDIRLFKKLHFLKFKIE